MASERIRKLPWEWIVIVALFVIGLGLVIYAFLPPAPPPYIG